ncbi:MAG: VCBS repeat-containing protein [Maricaulaceae bacterium]
MMTRGGFRNATLMQPLAAALAATSLAGCAALEPTGAPLGVGDAMTEARAPDGAYISWREHIIDDRIAPGEPLTGGDGLVLADLDGDGFEDIVSVHESDTEYDGVADGYIRIAFGTGDLGRWENVTLAQGPEAGAPEDAAIGDVNGDGLLDIIVAAELAHLIYFENPGPDAVRTGDWPRLILPQTQGRGSFIRVFLADFDGDGRLDVSTANKGEQNPTAETATPQPVSVFRANGDPLDGASWTETELGRYLIPQNARPVDIDADGDMDILAGARVAPELILFVNEAGGFREVPVEIDTTRAGGFNLAFHDFNADGRLDIAGATNAGFGWLEQPETLDGVWTFHRAGDFGPDLMVSIALADIDGDGDMDMLSGGYSRGPRDADADIPLDTPLGRIGWLENPGETGAAWTRHDVSRRQRGMFDKFVPRDLDGDGDIDFLGTRGNSAPYDGVFWLEQIRSDAPRAAFERARDEDSPEEPLAEGDRP